MILISHRGNIDGKNESLENTPAYIMEAIALGYQVEIDIWCIEGELYLGHDGPKTPFYFNTFEKHIGKLWIHCKNTEALSMLNEIDTRGIRLNYFSHDQDEAVLTSKGYLWSVYPVSRGILVMPEVTNSAPCSTTVGVCSDNIKIYG
jgi:hypothetical protein